MKKGSLLFKDTPYENELLSSWLTRLAHLNYLTLTSFLGAYFPKKNYSKYDLDLYEYNSSFFKKISNLTNTSIYTIKKLRLYQYEGYIEEKINTTGRHKWFTPLHSTNRISKFYGIRFCPMCLKENLYFRNSWRIIYNNICSLHKQYLLNRCPKCYSIISFTQTTYNLQIFNCHKCHFDLRNSLSVKINEKSIEYFYHKLLFNIQDKGYYIFQNKLYYSIGLFNLLRILCRNVIKKDIHYNKIYIEEFEPQVVSEIISKALYLLEDYPKNLIYFCKRTKLTNEIVFYDKNRHNKEELPPWFSI